MDFLLIFSVLVLVLQTVVAVLEQTFCIFNVRKALINPELLPILDCALLMPSNEDANGETLIANGCEWCGPRKGAARRQEKVVKRKEYS